MMIVFNDDSFADETLAVRADQPNDTVFTRAKEAFDAHFNPQQNNEFQRYMFRNLKQQDSGTILRQVATTCGNM